MVEVDTLCLEHKSFISVLVEGLNLTDTLSPFILILLWLCIVQI